MVQPPNPTSAALANNDIQLKATTTDTLQYLATRVGEIVEAKVIKVTQAPHRVDARIEAGEAFLARAAVAQPWGAETLK